MRRLRWLALWIPTVAWAYLGHPVPYYRLCESIRRVEE